MWRSSLILVLALFGLAPPSHGQRAGDLRITDFVPVRAAAALDPAPRNSPQPVGARLRDIALPTAAADVDGGDARLMFAGGLAGAVVGYLVGRGTGAGLASVLATEGVPVESYETYLRVLPAVASAAGAATGARSASCVKLLFGSVYPLNSCADGRIALLGALPGAIAQYLLQDREPGYIAAALAVEAAGVTIMGQLARQQRQEQPTW